GIGGRGGSNGVGVAQVERNKLNMLAAQRYWLHAQWLHRRDVRQYLGTEGSICSLHARMPPARFETFSYPFFFRYSATRWLRPPIWQWTTISRLRSISSRRLGTSFIGISWAPMLAILY